MVQGVPARPCRAWPLRALASAVAALVAAPVLAQSGPTDGAPSEAARRQALGPFRMILQNADPARKASAAPKKAPQPVATTPAAPAATPARSAVTAPAAPSVSPAPAVTAAPSEPVKPEMAPVPATSPAPPSATAPQPAVAPAPVALVAVKQEAPVLPAALRREQPEGIVKVGFAVKPDGSTTDVQVLSSTNRKLNSSSVAAVAGWRFKPIGETRPTEVELVYEPEKN